MKLRPTKDGDRERGWPGYLLGGHVRTSTVVLIIAFCAVWWTYDTYKPAPDEGPPPAAPQVVPPGFVPDPNYTWVPRTRVRQPSPTVTTPTTTTEPSETTTTSTTPPPPFQLPVLPPPFGPPPTPTTPPPPPPVPSPTPTTPPPR